MEPKTVVIDLYRCPDCGYITDSKQEFQKQSNVAAASIVALTWGCPHCIFSGEPKSIDGRSVESNLAYIQKHDSIMTQIQHIPSFEKFLGHHEIRELPNLLFEGENLEKLASGYYKNGYGIIAATNKRIIFIDKGMLYGLRVEDFPYDKITSIEYSTGLLRGEITIFASGNRAHITAVQKELVKDFSEHVRRRIVDKKSSSQTTPMASAAPGTSQDFITQLERLAKLKESGILTEEEFNEQKKKILSS
jgi:rubredoxin